MAQKIGKHAGGRPPKYQSDFARMAHVACVEGGFTDKKLALLFGVCEKTINNWKKEHKQFLQSVKDGKDDFDSNKVEAAFLKSCLGFRYTEKTMEPAVIARHGGAQPAEIVDARMVITKKVSKVVIPNGRDCLNWLTNRNASRWKKIKHVELTGENAGPVKAEGMVAVPSGPMSIAEWEKQVKEARKADSELEPGHIPGPECIQGNA